MALNAGILDELSELINEGKLYSVSDSVFNVKNSERAFWFLQAGKVVGKPVIYFKYVKYVPKIDGFWSIIFNCFVLYCSMPGDSDFHK